MLFRVSIADQFLFTVPRCDSGVSVWLMYDDRARPAASQYEYRRYTGAPMPRNVSYTNRIPGATLCPPCPDRGMEMDRGRATPMAVLPTPPAPADCAAARPARWRHARAPSRRAGADSHPGHGESPADPSWPTAPKASQCCARWPVGVRRSGRHRSPRAGPGPRTPRPTRRPRPSSDRPCHRSTTASPISPNPRRRKSAEDPVPSPRHMSERQRRHSRHRPATRTAGAPTRFRFRSSHTPPDLHPGIPTLADRAGCRTLTPVYDSTCTTVRRIGHTPAPSYNTPLSISRPPPGRMTMTTELSTNHLGRNSLGPTVQQPVRHIAIASGHLDTMLIWGILSVLMGVAWKDGGSFAPSLVPRTDRIDAVMVASMDSQSASTGQG